MVGFVTGLPASEHGFAAGRWFKVRADRNTDILLDSVSKTPLMIVYIIGSVTGRSVMDQASCQVSTRAETGFF